MNVSRDLRSSWAIHLKGALFVFMGLLSSGLLIFQAPTLRTVILLCLTVWAFCRFYYYLFYVLERYLGREKRFAGVLDAIGYLIASAKRRAPKA